MHRPALVIAALLALLPFCVHASGLFGTGIGSGFSGTIGTGAGAATYSGPGDLNTYVEAYSCSQALSAATRGVKLCNLCHEAAGVDTTCADALSDATTGIVVVPSPGAVLCAASGVNQCTVKTAYSLTATGHDATQTTVANRPLFNTTGVNSHPTISCTGGTVVLSNAAIATTASPLSMIGVASRTSVVGFDTPFDSNNGDVAFFFVNTGGSVNFSAGGNSPQFTYVEGNFVSLIGTNDGANTTISVNGAAALTSATGSTQIGTSIGVCNGANGGNPIIGQIGFMGYTATSVSNQAAINSGFHTVWNN